MLGLGLGVALRGDSAMAAPWRVTMRPCETDENL
jgi:hypothetical protein